MYIERTHVRREGYERREMSERRAARRRATLTAASPELGELSDRIMDSRREMPDRRIVEERRAGTRREDIERRKYDQYEWTRSPQ